MATSGEKTGRGRDKRWPWLGRQMAVDRQSIPRRNEGTSKPCSIGVPRLPSRWPRRPKKSLLIEQALCRTRTDDPFPTMEGCGYYGRSLTVSDGHEIPTNSHNVGCTPVVADLRSFFDLVDADWTRCAPPSGFRISRADTCPPEPAAVDLRVRPMRPDRVPLEPDAGRG